MTVPSGPVGPADSELLRRILTVTDAALSHLDTDALFKELLERLCGLLASDAAAIMLVDPDTGRLVTTSAVGLDEAALRDLRIDVNAGVDTVSAVMRDAGLASAVGVQMVAGGDLLGVLHVGSFEAREYGESDVALLQLVADRAALASRASTSLADRAATLALQRSLLPTRLPELAGVDLAGRYLPGHHLGVGGDWYDVFGLPSGKIGIVVGDVSGHGLRSAVVMGRLRSALRAYTLIEEDPGTVLGMLDRKIQYFEAGSLATVLYATFAPERGRLMLSAAGHLPPILAAPGRDAQMLSLPVDLPVGVGVIKDRQSTEVLLDPGSTLVVFTDGLVERRGQIIDDGLARLTGLIKPGPAETVCRTVMTNMDVNSAEDDIALLALHRASPA